MQVAESRSPSGGLPAGRPAGLERVAVGRWAPMPFLKPLSHPFLTGCLGSWSIDATGQLAGFGKATLRLGAGGTYMVEDLEWTSAVAPGIRYYAHSVWRPSAEGNRIAVQWFDNADPAVIDCAGTLTDAEADIRWQCNEGRRRLVRTVTEDGMESRLYIGEDALLRAIWRRA